jgi:two-component system chemotaxis response regulator CheY
VHALVIDDSRVMRSILKQTLKPLSFDVTEAEDGRDGLARLQAMPRPDLILVDWNMPIMNGLEFVQALRADAAFAGVPLMMVTTENDSAHVAQALQAGANEFLMKPFTAQGVREKLELLGLSCPLGGEETPCAP